MIIKSIQLQEVRKFNQAVKISGIENGLNVLSEVNEFGKSTIVDLCPFSSVGRAQDF